MNELKDITDFLENGHRYYRRGLSVDCAIFGYHEGALKLLLAKNTVITKWCLPGGFVRKDEGLDAAAARTTKERTGIENLFLKQFKTFGDPARNHDENLLDETKLFALTGFKLNKSNWIFDNAVSIGFYAITDIVNATPQPDILSSECAWFPVNELPQLGFDHSEMVTEALLTMRIHLYHFPIGKNLLPEKFTLKEIKLFYEVMSGKTLHSSNFPNKLISLGLIIKTDEKRKIGAHRSPTYYKFDEPVYEKALKEGLVLV